MIYCETSSLLKLIWPEPESEDVAMFIANEEEVVVSKLTVLECEVQLRAGWLTGYYSKAQFRRQLKRMKAVLATAPFRLESVSGSVFDAALRQNRASENIHCRSMDRLHLAAMEVLGIRRLLSHDAKQADAAGAMGYTVVMP